MRSPSSAPHPPTPAAHPARRSAPVVPAAPGPVAASLGLSVLRPAPTLLQDPRLAGRGNQGVRQAALQQVQQTHGNRAVQRLVRRSPLPVAPLPPRLPIQRRVDETPTDYVDRRAEYSTPTAEEYQRFLADYFTAPVGDDGATFRAELQRAYHEAPDPGLLERLELLESLYTLYYQQQKYIDAQFILEDLAALVNEVQEQAATPVAPSPPGQHGDGEEVATSFDELVDQTEPDWYVLVAHGAQPKTGHSFVYRFTTVDMVKWQKSHLGREIEETGMTEEELAGDPQVPFRGSLAEKKTAQTKKRLAKQWKRTQGVLDPEGDYGPPDEAVAREIKLKPGALETARTQLPILAETVQRLREGYQKSYSVYNHTYPGAPLDPAAFQHFFDAGKGQMQLAQRQLGQEVYGAAGKLAFEEGTLQMEVEKFKFYEKLPTEPQAAAAYMARWETLLMARDHFAGRTPGSPFASTAEDYQLTVKSTDKVMQSIFRSDENLEATPEWDPQVQGREKDKKRAKHLVRYEIPNRLLVAPAEVEQAFGLGSSPTEGFVAMRAIKERLFLGDDLSDYMVAVAVNPF